MTSTEKILALIDSEIAEYQARPLTRDCPGARAILAKLLDLRTKASVAAREEAA